MDARRIYVWQLPDCGVRPTPVVIVLAADVDEARRIALAAVDAEGAAYIRGEPDDVSEPGATCMRVLVS